MNAPEQIFQTALEHFESGRLSQAEKLLRALHKDHPRVPDILHLLGLVMLQADRPGEAKKYLKKADKVAPGSAEILTLLGCAYHREGRAKQAIGTLRDAVKAQPGYADAHYNLGLVLEETGDLDRAMVHYRDAIEADPDLAAAHYNLGLALKKTGQRDKAAAHYRKAIQAAPGEADALNALGVVLMELGELAEAREYLDQAVALQPDTAEYRYNLGNLLRKQDALTKATETYEAALELNPAYIEAINNLGFTFQDQGRIDDAFALYHHALTLDGNLASTHSNLIFCMNYSPKHDGEAILAEARKWNDLHAAPLARHIKPHRNEKDENRRLRLGYVSADFRKHPVGFFFEPVIGAHDGDAFETFCYAASDTDDAVTKRIRGHAGHWVNITGMDDGQAAERIRQDQIDILVDCSGHTGDNRLKVFARKPAPVQATGFGLFGTTGVEAIDAILTDPRETPEGSEALYSETVVRLPDGYVCYQPPDYAAEPSPPPFAGNGFITFGCFNNLAKVTPEVVALWSEILDAVPGSRILLKTSALDDPPARERYLGLFAANGIDGERVLLSGRDPHEKFIAAYGQIDIALDPFPYSGGLTTLEALWMGVPVITLAGETFAERHSASHLGNIGLGELVCDSQREYAACATGLAGDAKRLAGLRAGLRERMGASPVCNAGRYTRNLEAAYRSLWQQWCAK